MTTPRDLRVGDAERSRAADLIDEAYADGRLDNAEHTERVSAALAARTVGDLADLLADLGPGLTDQLGLATAAGSGGGVMAEPWTGTGRGSLVQPGAAPTVERITSVLSDVTRGAGGVLGGHVEINAALSEVKLDLTRAVLTHHRTVIEVHASLAEVVVLVPDGLQVTSKVIRILADESVKGVEATHSGDPVVEITGWLALGELNVIGPGHRKFERYRSRWNS